MDTKGTIKFYKSDNILLSDSNYYKYIFKRTEKIVCTVFYLISHTDKGQNDIIGMSFMEIAKQTLDAVLRTLSCRSYTAQSELYAVLDKLIALESNVRLAQAAAILQEEVADLLSLEIETVLRGLRQYIGYEKSALSGLSSFDLEQAASPTENARDNVSRMRARAVPASGRKATDQEWNTNASPLPSAPQPSPSQTTPPRRRVKGQRTERQRMIKDMLASNRRSPIKDILAKMSDWSEKTIQREIVAMVSDGTIVKEGERRWSRYSLAPGA